MDDAEDTAAAMAAVMGFSGFGAQKPNKRRKFNPSTDAFVASDSLSASTSALPSRRYNDGSIATTGSNNVPLGVRKKNDDEIDLDGDADEERISPEDETARQTTADNDDEDPEPQYLDTSRPPAPAAPDAAQDLQSKIDDIVGGSADPSTAPQLSFPVVDGGHSTRGGRGGRQRNANRDGRSGNKWWADYYDPSFIVNPWDKLEKAHGLEPRGTWVSWDEAKAAQV
ncbi:hypothetical protein F4802DRAFT_489252 [Xylaria palmicola]|nr:hypothetical protein F4802DRAFT_489252 [Xylaria palmicola]